jgi:hypothetical protein
LESLCEKCSALRAMNVIHSSPNAMFLTGAFLNIYKARNTRNDRPYWQSVNVLRITQSSSVNLSILATKKFTWVIYSIKRDNVIRVVLTAYQSYGWSEEHEHRDGIDFTKTSDRGTSRNEKIVVESSLPIH